MKWVVDWLCSRGRDGGVVGVLRGGGWGVGGRCGRVLGEEDGGWSGGLCYCKWIFIFGDGWLSVKVLKLNRVKKVVEVKERDLN